MPPVGKKKPICKACEDTGKNSKGGPCQACVLSGRISAKPDLPPSLRKKAPAKGEGLFGE